MSERDRIIDELLRNDIVVESEAVEIIMERGGLNYIPELVKKFGKCCVIRAEDLVHSKEKSPRDISEKTKKSYEKVEREKIEIRRVVNVKTEKSLSDIPATSGTSRRKERDEYDWDFKVLLNAEISEPASGGVDDFVAYFNDRYRRLARIIRNRVEIRNEVSIANLISATNEVSIIGIVSDVRVSKRGTVLFTLEDPTGSVNCIYPQGEFLINDEVVGVIGRYSEERNVFYVREIVRGGFSHKKSPPLAEHPVSTVIISDIHIGSKMFLKDRWEKFLQWLKKGDDGASTVKYLLVGGDLVDGIGIYPNQEEELEIDDIYAQYESLATYFEDIPDSIKVIVIPGNHDMVRNTEPQPPLPSEIRKMFNGHVEFLSNPSVFLIHGYRFLMYHGASLNDLVEVIPQMNYNRIDDLMKFMLETRHLVPLYGGKVPIAPLPRDYLAIDIVPDVFITGHVHAYSYANYHGVHLINASTWQAQTKYQKMMNFNPDPCKVAVLDFHKNAIRKLQF